ncbi:MAG: hydroxymethylglutaryl-CoA synthase family protein [Deltaproteobacteria bacterium]|nr:hydroxymethylglutaryl-CoA synthase family protein [Deltaproteobacteria bacterium]
MGSIRSVADVGIEALAVHVPRHYLDVGTLARANGVDPGKYCFGLGCRRMAVVAPDEDPVVLAVRAASGLFERYDIDPACVGMVVVGTESGVDAAKPIATYVHRMAGLPRDCRTFDIQHACYGGTAGLRMATGWVLGGLRPGKKALVIATDVARYEIGSPGEPTQGAAAVAMLVGDEPRVLRLEPYPEAVHTEEVMDFWRPTYRATALADGHHSIECYLRALEGCWGGFTSSSGLGLGAFDYLLYHSPFPKMAFKAHKRLYELATNGAAGFDPDYERRVLPTLWSNAEVGNAYSASLYVSLAGLLEHAEVDAAGKRVGLFSYGSGCCAEFIAARVGDDAAAWRGRTGLRQVLAARREITHESYLRFRQGHEELARDGSFRTPLAPDGVAFCGTWNHQRVYRDATWPAAVASARPGDTCPPSDVLRPAPRPARAQAGD